jgi:hypothetical protein
LNVLNQEPLYGTQGISKAMLDVAGKPMIHGCRRFGVMPGWWIKKCMAGLTDSGLTCLKVNSYSQPKLMESEYPGCSDMLRLNPQAQHVLVVRRYPAITGDGLDEHRHQTSEDAYYNVISRQVMEGFSLSAPISVSGRKVQSGHECLATRLVTTNDEIWIKIVAASKNALKQAALLVNLLLLLSTPYR